MVGYIYSDDMGKLDSLFFKYDFNKYPNDLPNPKKGNSQWPLSYFVIGYRENPSDKIKMVYVDQTVSGNYPDRFFEFLYKLDTGIQLYQ